MVEEFTDEEADEEDRVDAIDSYNLVALKVKKELQLLVQFSDKSLNEHIISFGDELDGYQTQILSIAIIAIILQIFFGTLFGGLINKSLQNLQKSVEEIDKNKDFTFFENSLGNDEVSNISRS